MSQTPHYRIDELKAYSERNFMNESKELRSQWK